MPRNYKTGPRRSRRRPDPSSVYRLGQPVFPFGAVTVTPGAGSLVVEALAFNPTTGASVANDLLKRTSSPTTVRFINSAGDVFVPTVTVVTAGTTVRYEIASGLPADDYVVASNALDPAVRAKFNGWIGTLFENATVT